MTQGFSSEEAARVAWVSKDMNAHDDYMARFMEVFSELDWWGPATPEATRRALAIVPVAPQTILEIGCGPGMARMTLAEATTARITATGTDDGAFDRPRAGLAARGLGEQVTVRNLDMAQLPVPDQPWDVIWAEGSAYIVEDQFHKINAIWNDGSNTYKSILFVGHSLGSLLAIAIVLCASDDEYGPDKSAAACWRSKIDRIVLLAGMNRGWSSGHHLSLRRQLQWNFGALVGEAWQMMRGKPFLIMSLRRGAPFLTELRVRWIKATNNAKTSGFVVPLTIQLLGSVDDVVAPSDNLDLVSGRKFVYLHVPYSGHKTVVDLASDLPVDGPYREKSTMGAERKRVLKGGTASVVPIKYGSFLTPKQKKNRFSTKIDLTRHQGLEAGSVLSSACAMAKEGEVVNTPRNFELRCFERICVVFGHLEQASGSQGLNAALLDCVLRAIHMTQGLRVVLGLSMNCPQSAPRVLRDCGLIP